MGIVTCTLKGRTGNQLFQISSAISYGLKYGLECLIPNYLIRPQFEDQKVFYSANLKYTDKEYSPFRGIVNVYDEPFFHFKEIPKFDCEVLVLNGYFQSWRYIEPYKDEIIKLLNIKRFNLQDEIFIHYRLGDYKHLNKYHKIISEEYLSNAIQFFAGRQFKNFIVFSDEIEEAKHRIKSLGLDNLNIEYSEGLAEEEDLILMASCSGGIMSASSFSWWAAFLGDKEGREIIYPAQWFGEMVNHDIKDLCPPNWIKL